ncbi:hypothetical protein GCM10027047_22950 [Rhodococcus aerolatus]
MRGLRRWALVAVATAALVGVPTVVLHQPAADDPVPATELLARVTGSTDVGWSGYAESVGTLALPETDRLSQLADLLGSRTRVRAWYLSPTAYRVDTQLVAGEDDLIVDAAGSWRWSYEQNLATRTATGGARLPEAVDLTPPELGRRLLSEADPTAVSRLPPRTVAGVDAPGLRVVPSDPRSTVSAVDVWADPTTGVPLAVQVLGVGSDRPVVDTAFLDVDLTPPAPERVEFTPPPNARVELQNSDALDQLAAQVGGRGAPDTLVGLPVRRDVLDATSVGVYGRGVTAVVALPLPRSAFGALRTQLIGAPGAETSGESVAVSVGPFGIVLVSPADRRPAYLVTGTLTLDTLRQAGADLSARRT